MRDDEARQLAAAQARLVSEFEGRFSPEEVDRCFTAVMAAFEGAPVRTYVPVLASRRVRSELQRVVSP